ncbi:MAG: cation:proton antiporter [Caldilineaceae bacterium]
MAPFWASAIAQLIAQIDDYLIEITLTTVAAFGSYLIAEHFHMSGVLAVVMAGLINATWGHAACHRRDNPYRLDQFFRISGVPRQLICLYSNRHECGV